MTRDDSSLRDGSAAAVLRTLETNDPASAEELVPLVYDELRQLARRQLSREVRNPTLHTTELVHEAYLRLARGDGVTDRGRAYFFAAAAQAMRRVLIDSARRRTTAKRGGDPTRVTFADDLSAVDAYADELLDLDRALSALEAEHPRAAHVVECRYFGGLTVEDTAATLEISPRTVKSDWALARAWLYRAMNRRVGDSIP